MFDTPGLEPMTSVVGGRCLDNWATEAHANVDATKQQVEMPPFIALALWVTNTVLYTKETTDRRLYLINQLNKLLIGKCDIKMSLKAVC